MQWKLFILEVVAFYIAFILTIYVHEAGHYITAKIFRFKVSGFRVHYLFKMFPMPNAVHVNIDNKYLENVKLFKIKIALVYLNGILLGFVPITLYTHYTTDTWLIAWLNVIYLYGCSKDCLGLINIARGKEIEEDELTVTIPISEEECKSTRPKCEDCGYCMIGECKGKPRVKFSYEDAMRVSRIVQDKYGEAKRVEYNDLY